MTDLPSIYREGHFDAFNKIAARPLEAREFLLSVDFNQEMEKEMEKAIFNRWFGNINETYYKLLFRHLYSRFNKDLRFIKSLQEVLRDGLEYSDFLPINHFFMLLDDPYYRWCASEYIPQRLNHGLIGISRESFKTELKKVLPIDFSPSTIKKYSQNAIAALTENDLLQGKIKKSIQPPKISTKSLAIVLHGFCGMGLAEIEFQSSPFYKSLMKPVDVLQQYLIQGEREGHWENNSDDQKIVLKLKHQTFQDWVEKN